MKIWIVNHYAMTPDFGASTRHYSLAKELEKLGHQVTIIAADNHHFRLSKVPSLIQDESSILHPKYDHVNFIFLPTASYRGNGVGRLWNMLSFTWQILKLRRVSRLVRPDIIIGSSVHLFAVWAAEKLAKHYQVPFYFEVRDIWPQSLIEMKVLSRWHPLALVLKYLEHRLYRRAKKIITLLPYLHEYLQIFNISKDKILYIPNGVDLETFPCGNFDVSATDSLTIMYLGSHGIANGLDVIIEAAADLEKNPPSRKIKWRLIGDGPYKKQLEQKASQLGLNTLVFEDRVSKLQVPYVLAQATILIVNLIDVPVYRYGISLNKLFDYLAAGRPVIFGCGARNNPIAEAGSGITVPPQDSRAIVQAVRSMAEMSENDFRIMANLGRQHVENHYSYAILAKILSDDFLENLSKSS